MNNYLRIYNKKQSIEIADRLKILRQIMKGAVKETLMQTDLIVSCRLKYTTTIENMCDALRTGRRQYIKNLRVLTDTMETYCKNLIESEAKLDYLKSINK